LLVDFDFHLFKSFSANQLQPIHGIPELGITAMGRYMPETLKIACTRIRQSNSKIV